MEPKPKPGRDARGQFVSNDATIGQFAEAIIHAIEVLSYGKWLHKEQQAEFEGHLATARAAAGLADAGKRPEGAD
jgi:hypothetical protein